MIMRHARWVKVDCRQETRLLSLLDRLRAARDIQSIHLKWTVVAAMDVYFVRPLHCPRERPH